MKNSNSTTTNKGEIKDEIGWNYNSDIVGGSILCAHKRPKHTGKL